MSSGEQLLTRTKEGALWHADARWLLSREKWLPILKQRVDHAQRNGHRTMAQLQHECLASVGDIEMVLKGIRKEAANVND